MAEPTQRRPVHTFCFLSIPLISSVLFIQPRVSSSEIRAYVQYSTLCLLNPILILLPIPNAILKCNPLNSIRRGHSHSYLMPPFISRFVLSCFDNLRGEVKVKVVGE